MAKRTSQAKRVAVSIPDVSGGQVTAVHPFLLNSHEARVAEDIHYEEKGTLESRPGSEKRYPNAFNAGAVRGLGAYYKKDGTTRLVAAVDGALYYDLPHLVEKYDTQADWDTGTKVRVDTGSAPGSVKISAVVPTLAFTRSSVAYDDQGNQVAADTPRYPAAKFNQGLLVETSTTNLLTANQSSAETDTSGFAGSFSSTLTRDTSQAWHGSASLKVTSTGTRMGFSTGSALTTVTAGQTYTASAYVKGTGNTVGRTFEIRLRENGGSFTSKTFAMTSDWQRVSVTGTIASDITQALIEFVDSNSGVVSGDVFWADGLQIEQKSYPTSWTLGDTTRAAELPKATLPEPLPAEWYASGWFIPKWPSTVTRSLVPRFFGISRATPDTNNRYVLYFETRDGFTHQFSFAKTSGGVVTELGSGAISFVSYDQIFLAAANLTQPHGDLGAGMHLWVKVGANAMVHVSNVDTTAVSDLVGLYPGAYPGASGHEADGIIDDFLLSEIPPDFSQATIDALAAGTSPATADAYTIAKFSFDQTLADTKPEEGIWLSPWIDISQASDPNSGIIAWAADVPANTSVTIETRTSPDGTEANATAWAAAANGGLIQSPYNSRLQVRAVEGRTDPAANPELMELTVSYDGTPQMMVLKNTGLTAGAEYDFETAMDLFLAANGYDPILKWDAATDPTSLGGSPPLARWLVYHANRLFAAGMFDVPSRIRWSEVLDVETWDVLNFIDIAPDDGDILVGLAKWGNRLVLPKRRSVRMLLGQTEEEFEVRDYLVDSDVGNLAPNGLVALESAFGFVARKGYCLYDGVELVVITDSIKETWQQVNPKRLDQVAAKYDDAKLYIAVPWQNSTVNNKVLVFDMRRSAWAVYNNWEVSRWLTFSQYGADHKLFGSSTEGQVWEWGGSRTADGPTPITPKWESKQFDFGEAGIAKIAEPLRIKAPKSGAQRTFRLGFVVDGAPVSQWATITVPADVNEGIYTTQIIPAKYGARVFETLGFRIESDGDPLKVYELSMTALAQGLKMGA